MPNLSGQYLGRYHLIEQLGEGGMAVVYKAYDTRLEREVAVKIIRGGTFHQETLEEVLKRFEREAKALAKLSYPNIVKVHDYGEHDGSPYLVMEYLPGGTLKKFLGKPIPWQDALHLLLPIARGVAYAHQHGILHRDIKPANILITETGEPMLSDFGIAKLFEGEQTTALTGTGMAIGTPEYMAPEQWTGQTSPQSDLYSLGVVLYEMVTGRKPYVADTPAAILLKQAMEPLPAPRQFAPELPETVNFLLIKALARDPQERYPDLKAFVAAMEELLRMAPTAQPRQYPAAANLTPQEATTPFVSTPTEAWTNEKPIPPVKPTGTQSATGKSATDQTTQNPQSRGLSGAGWFAIFGGVILLGGLLVLVAALILFLPRYLQSAASATEPPSVLSQITATPGNDLQPVKADTPAPLAAAPLAATPLEPTPISAIIPTSEALKLIAFNSRMAGNADIYVINTNGDNLTRLTSSPAHELYPSWSPDGTELVYQTNEGGDMELAIVNVKTKAVRSLTKNECDDWGPVWSPKGDWIVFYSNCDGDKASREIYKIRPDGKSRTQLTFTSNQNNWFPAWSTDGQKITFTSNRAGKYHIYTMDANGNNQKDLASGCVSYYSPDETRILYGVYCDDTDALWLMNADGSDQHPITSGRQCRNATWSPDGKKIVFQESPNGKSGPFSIYIMDLAQPDPTDWFKVVDESQNGGSPVWQP